MKDLHIHTKYSDGELNEEEIVKSIIDAKVDEFCITDHDNILGSQKVFEYLQNNKDNSEISNLKFHTGVELSCKVPELFGGINVHILVRDFEFDNKVLKAFVDEISEKRAKKTKLIIEAVESLYNVKFDEKRVQDKVSKTYSFGKPHAFALLCELGDYDREDFYNQMNNFKFTNLKLDTKTLLFALKDENCNTTLAHPKEIMEEYNLSYQDIETLVKYLKECGLKAVETRHSKHTEQDIAEYEKIAKKYDLKTTQGSDYHGKIVKPNVFLGKCYKD